MLLLVLACLGLIVLVLVLWYPALEEVVRGGGF
jgi:hypothetical protein